MPKIKYSRNKKIIEESEKFNDLIRENNLKTENGIVLLTRENADIVEDLIKKDDDYFPFSEILFKCFPREDIKSNNNRALFAIVREIDRDNRTNVWRYNKNRTSLYRMVAYISDEGNGFFKRLHEGDIVLPDHISDSCGPGIKSLSSKVCKYLCEYAYNEDNYYVNDAFVRAMLLFYLDYYKVEHPEIQSIGDVDKLTYRDFFAWLEKLHNGRNQAHGGEISKSELDHIIWYCYKSYEI